MNFKFSTISKPDLDSYNILRKGISAKVFDFEENTTQKGEKYGKFTLQQGKSKITVLAFGETYDMSKSVLKPKTKKEIHFPSGTFSCKPRNKKFSSNSTCKFDMFFVRGSSFLNVAKSTLNTSPVQSTSGDETCSLQEVSQLLKTSKQTIAKKMKSIKFKDGNVYRYWGCKDCNFSIPRKHSDGKYYCKGTKCNNKKARKSKIGVVRERKICFAIYNVKLSDDKNDVTIESVVLFNSVCESLLGKSGPDFDTDDEAVEAWQELTERNNFNITLRRHKRNKVSEYAPAIFVEVAEMVNNIVGDASSTMTDTATVMAMINNFEAEDSLPTAEMPNDFVEDANPDEFYGEKKKRKRVPDFLQFEMKLQHTSLQYKDYVGEYQINSKPRGLVLLINNYNFPHNVQEPQRKGSEIDMQLLQNGFLEMGYKIYGDKCQMDVKTKNEFKQLIGNYKRQLIEEEVDSIFIIISSHGLNLQVELSEGDYVWEVEELMIPFSDEKFPEYHGKPKVFMPIVCQNLGRKAFGKSLHLQANNLFDMLVCCPALPGYTQNRIYNKGTLFVNLLMFNLMKFATSWNFVEILEKVQMDFMEQIKRKQLTEWTVPHHHGSTFRPFHLIPKTKLISNFDTDNPLEVMDID